ncbi:polysaccharide biosynthesis tyrosine autokinase [Paraburkholderia lacunae]|uniref:Putative tyrosine-protein kinase EpsB n=1 Tax=Paraburkholderia lacunae TaxID=2211104 RepID=A0A370NB06_9BURK|nr:polysaccharide biosynthesis tyrosine autokinase [Paraburkholderia lacunae]RDK02779.1 tyrosine protein kinase [Paraburkholderia lacunae]
MNSTSLPDHISSNASVPEELKLGVYLDALYDNWRLITSVAFAVVLVATMYAFLETPIYRADILIQVEDNPNSTKNILGDVASMFDVKTEASAEIEILRSRMVVTRTVDNLKTYIHANPVYFPFFGHWLAEHLKGVSKPGVFGYGGFCWGEERVRVPVMEVPSTMYDKEFVVVADAPGAYTLKQSSFGINVTGEIGKKLSVATDDGRLDLIIDEIHANPGAKFKLVRLSRLTAIENLQRDLRIEEKGKQSGILQASLDGSDRRLTTSILNEIALQYVRQNVDRKTEEAEKSIEFLDNQLPELKSKLEISENKFNNFRASHGTVEISEEATAILQRSVEQQNSLVALEQKREELANRFTVDHPAITALDGQIAQMRQQLAELAESARKLPPLEQQVLRLQRDVQVNTDLYTTLLNTSQQLRLIRAGKIGNVRLVDYAMVPEVPIKPKRPLVIGFSVVIGLLAGITASWIKHALFARVTDPHDLEFATGLPVYAVVPQSRLQESLFEKMHSQAKGQFLLASAEPNDAAIESLRSFRAALQFALLDTENNIVLVTGPTPGIGKSFIAANLSTVLASSNYRVLLIDADLRRGYLHQYFGIGRSLGLSELLSNSCSFKDVVRCEVLPNLDMVTTGGIVPNPSELMLQISLTRLLDSVKDRYDFVLIDSPPVLSVADTAVLARHAAVVFMVARQDVTMKGEFNESIRRLSQVGVVVKGIVFNGLKARPGRYGYGYRHYRYSSYAYDSYQGPKND